MNDLLISSLARLDLSTQQSSASRRGRRTPSFQTLSDSSSSNGSPTPSTSSFESDSDETISARSDTLSFLSGSSDSIIHSNTTRKLLFYHSLLTLFGKLNLFSASKIKIVSDKVFLKGVGVRPPSIKKCVAILRGIHVNLKEFLAYIHNGGNISEVTRVSCTFQLKM